MKTSHGNVFITALIFIALALSAAGGAYLWQTRRSPSTTALTEPATSIQPTVISSTFTDHQWGFSVKLPGEIIEAQRAAYGLELSNLVKEVSTIIGAIGTDHEMVDTFWITVQVVDKSSPQINSFDWLLGVSGYVQDPANIPQGDIYFAYERAKMDKTGSPVAINFKSYILSQKKGPDRYELGWDNGAKFIYSNIFSKSDAKYVYIISLYIYSPSLFPQSGKWLADWVREEKAAVENYRHVVDSFKLL